MQKICKPNLLELTKFPVEIIIKRVFLRIGALSDRKVGQTTGTPISMIVRNKDQRSRDYGNIAQTYRPGHADFGFDSKYGFRDYRGGGRSSGRETIGRVAAGAIAAKILKELGITLQAYTRSIGPVSCHSYHPEVIKENSFYMPFSMWKPSLSSEPFIVETLIPSPIPTAFRSSRSRSRCSSRSR